VRGDGLGLDETIKLVGRHRWVEGRLFEVLGGWVQAVHEPEAKILFDVHSRQHAWHCELWEQRLAELGEADPDRVSEPSPTLAALMDALGSAADTLERAVGTYRVVVPRKVSAYELHLGDTSAVSDGPVIRSLRLALSDELDAWREGESLVHSLLLNEDDARRAASFQARLEAILVAGPPPPP
jgi:hypothetical protein